LDTKRTLSAEQYLATIQAVHDDPAVDLVLVAEELPRAAGVDRKLANFRSLDSYIATEASKPIVCFSPVTTQQTDYMLSLRSELSRITWLRDLSKTLRVASRLAPAAASTPIADRSAALNGIRQRLTEANSAGGSSFVLNEQDSKEIFRSVGIVTPQEIVLPGFDVEDALDAARRIGFPVVVKAVTAAVTHKSDAGLVILDVKDESELRNGLTLLQERCAQRDIRPEGILIAELIKGGVEVVVGLHRDAEVGPVVMFGAGGVLLELLADVAFGPPGLDDARARDMIFSTRVAKLLTGFRGSAPCDIEALVRAVRGVGALAYEAGDLIETAEINPLIVRPDGVYALDALIVTRRENKGT
jgi:acetyltransferase